MVARVVPFVDAYSENDLLRTAACLEEHFPHSMANAVVQEAKELYGDMENPFMPIWDKT